MVQSKDVVITLLSFSAFMRRYKNLLQKRLELFFMSRARGQTCGGTCPGAQVRSCSVRPPAGRRTRTAIAPWHDCTTATTAALRDPPCLQMSLPWCRSLGLNLAQVTYMSTSAFAPTCTGCRRVPRPHGVPVTHVPLWSCRELRFELCAEQTWD